MASRAEDTPPMTEEEFTAQLDQILGTYFNQPVRTGNTITYTLNSQLCMADETATPEDIANCQAVISQIAIVQVLTSETSGTVNLVFGSNAPLTLGYSDTEIYVEINLAETKSALIYLETLISALGLNDSSDTSTSVAESFPETFEGIIRLTLSAPSETEVAITLGIVKAINIDGMLDGDPITLTLAKSLLLFQIQVTETEATLTSEIGAFHMLTNDPDDLSDTPDLMDVSMGGSQLHITINANGDTLTITDTGLVDELSFKYGPDTNDLSEALNITLPLFDATLAATDTSASLTFDTALAFEMAVTNLNGRMSDAFIGVQDATDPTLAGTLSVDAPAGTELGLIPETATASGALMVTNGSLDIVGTGDLEGSVSAATNECIGEPADPTTAGFFVELTSCPTVQ